jgi:hypothetical protein
MSAFEKPVFNPTAVYLESNFVVRTHTILQFQPGIRSLCIALPTLDTNKGWIGYALPYFAVFARFFCAG